MARPIYSEVTCPRCGWSCEIRMVPATRIDPGYPADDPPEECPECAADLTAVDSEPCNPFDMSERADAAFDMGR